MLTDEMKADGWIEHDGGPCPVPLDSKPGVIIRGFDRNHDISGDPADYYLWPHCRATPSANIIAYRPVKP